MHVKRIVAALVAAGALVTVATTVPAGAAGKANPVFKNVGLNGAGATFPLNYYEQMRADVAKNFGLQISYQGIGSGGGRSNFINGTVDFAGSDVPLSGAEKNQLSSKGVGFVQIATIGGPIVIGYNPKSGLPDGLKMSADTVGKIFSGRITRWNDAQLKSENPGESLPNVAIRVAARADSSGTTNGFTSFMAVATRSWTGGVRNTFNSPSLPNFPGLLTAQGNDGVANAVRDNTGMVGYMELSFAKERKLGVSAVGVPAGYFLPTAADVSKTLSSARINSDGSVTFDHNAAQGYPISVVTYILARTDMGDAQKAANLRAFLFYMLGDGQAKANSLNYAPLPANVKNSSIALASKIGPSAAGPA